MYMPPEELLVRLASADCTAADVEEYLWGQAEELERDHEGPWAPDIYLFFRGEDDLSEYRLAKAWWPDREIVTTLPPLLVRPTVFQLCYAYNESDPRIGATFQARLYLRAEKVVNWLTAQGLDTSHPNETKEQRKERLARAAQQKHRERVNGKRDESTALYKAYLDACARRKAAYDQLTPEVELAHAAWQASKG